MLPEGLLSIAIRADVWQPQNNERNRINQILTSACCTRQSGHIKRVAMSRPFYRDAKTAKCVVILLLLPFLRHTFYFHTISQEILQIHTELIHH